MNDNYHNPPFQKEIIQHAEIAKDGVVFDLYGGDGTYGVILLGVYPKMDYYYFDVDDKAVSVAKQRLKKFGIRAHIERQNCRYLEKRISNEGLSTIDCVIYDPGLRREYVTNPDRGFIVRESGPLDGRFDRRSDLMISDVVNGFEQDRLVEIFRTADVPFPGRIARAIVERRSERSINTTTELDAIVSKSTPRKGSRKEGKLIILVMLALRMHVNEELQTLNEVIHKGFQALRHGGRLLTISYHSGEARIYKQFARKFDERYADDPRKRIRVLNRKALKSSEDEISRNPLIRSAQFRAYEKIV